jgi:hypothetical protein
MLDRLSKSKELYKGSAKASAALLCGRPKSMLTNGSWTAENTCKGESPRTHLAVNSYSDQMLAKQLELLPARHSVRVGA